MSSKIFKIAERAYQVFPDFGLEDDINFPYHLNSDGVLEFFKVKYLEAHGEDRNWKEKMIDVEKILEDPTLGRKPQIRV